VCIDSGKPGKTIAIRADFDALPIQEATGLPFASKNDFTFKLIFHFY
jgi:metal-dependent amidase/aminoacylase/carboxypeptidase family protein